MRSLRTSTGCRAECFTLVAECFNTSHVDKTYQSTRGILFNVVLRVAKSQMKAALLSVERGAREVLSRDSLVCRTSKSYYVYTTYIRVRTAAVCTTPVLTGLYSPKWTRPPGKCLESSRDKPVMSICDHHQPFWRSTVNHSTEPTTNHFSL